MEISKAHDAGVTLAIANSIGVATDADVTVSDAVVADADAELLTVA